MAISYTDPDNPSADTSVETPDTGTDWFTTNAPYTGPPGVVFSPGLTGPASGFVPADPSLTSGWVHTPLPGGGTYWGPALAGASSGASYGPSTDWSNPSNISSYFASLGVTPSSTSPQYWADAWNSWGKNDPNYFWSRLQSADEIVAAGKAKPYAGGDSGGGPVGDYTTPTTPNYLQSPYTPTPFTEQFTAPTLSDLQATPGYQAGLNTYLQGVQRAQAASGNILSGGAVKALGRDAADYANQQYQTIYNNAFDAYKAKYGIAQDANNNNLAARQLNDNEFNQNVTNSLNQYLTRYGAYQDLIKNNLSYARLGLDATQAGNPGGSGASVG